MADRMRMKFLLIALVVLLTMVGCANSEAGVSADVTSTVASSQVASTEPQPTQDSAIAESQPTQDPANVKQAPTGPQPTALPTQPIPLRGTDADGDGFYTSTEFQDAITALIAYYQWPDAYYPNVEPLFSTFQGDITHEVPGEYTIVGRQFRCAWGQAWLDAFAAGDTATMDASMQHLRDELSLNPIRPSSTQASIKDMYDKASLGDPALLLRHVEVNCGGLEWLDQPATPG